MKKSRAYILFALAGIAVGAAVVIAVDSVCHKTSTNDYCMSCHYHEDADIAWKQSYHYNNESGVKTDCAACHLPPEGSFNHFATKAKLGIRDLWVHMTKNKEDIDWNAKGELEYAQKIVFNESCKECHVNLYPAGITDDGVIAHLHYDENEKKLDLQCISCHLDAGHYNPNYNHSKMLGIPGAAAGGADIYQNAAEVTEFKNFTETVPGTAASIEMIAVPGGEFLMGSPENEPMRGKDEGPQKRVVVSPFFMSEVEVTWNQYWAFYGETMSEGRIAPETIYAANSRPDIDAVSGPTPPFGNPDQGWGMGDRPAITMTHYAAEVFCLWLSVKTGKHYRLPTEAEWEYAARGGTQTPYFFEGNPKKYSSEGILKGIFPPDTSVINGYVVYERNSRSKTADPSEIKANPFGLKNMAGNVMEYCSDYYAEDAYSRLEDGAKDPKGPESGDEYVVRGGQYTDDAALVRSAARSHTEHDAWLRTDPQNPKSIWWYSDIKGIGFRVVCEVPENINTK